MISLHWLYLNSKNCHFSGTLSELAWLLFGYKKHAVQLFNVPNNKWKWYRPPTFFFHQSIIRSKATQRVKKVESFYYCETDEFHSFTLFCYASWFIFQGHSFHLFSGDLECPRMWLQSSVIYQTFLTSTEKMTQKYLILSSFSEHLIMRRET